jgi:hypothetical protein
MATIMGIARVPDLLERWPLVRHRLGASVPDGLDLLSPAMGTMASGTLRGFLITGMIAIAVALIAEYIRPQWERAAFVILVALLMATDAATLGTFLREAAFHVVVFAAAWLAVKHILRFNVLGYFLLAAMTVLIPEAIDLITQPNAYFHGNGYAVIAFAAVLVAWPLLSWRRNATSARVQ